MRKWATATAVTVVALALLVGGVLLLVLLQRSLVATTEDAARAKASDVAAMIASQDVSEAGQALAATPHPGQYVQIIGPQRQVAAASDASAGRVALTNLQPAPGQTLTEDVSGLPSLGDTDEFLVVATGVSSGQERFAVVVASTVQVQADTLMTVAWFLLGAAPVLLAVVGGAVWILVGRSLHQVERIRAQVARIDSSRLDERVQPPDTNDEIHRLALTMNTMLDRLQASDAEQRRFVSDASHELRSPLATISAGLEIAAADPSGDTWRGLHSMLGGEAARMRYLVDDLLTLAKANDGGLNLALEDVDLDDVLGAEVSRLRSMGRHAVGATATPAKVAGDPRRLAQVLRNVLENADRHARTRITVNLAEQADGVHVTIDNDGDPVPEADRERIFDRFVRLDDSRAREGGGSGLGLAIAAGIMESHHGSIVTLTAPNGDCRFELVLPSAVVP